MASELFNWSLGLVKAFSEFGEWLITPFFGDFTPLTLFGVAGLTGLIGILLVHLFI